MAYQRSVHQAMGCTPASIMLGQELHMPTELLYGRPPGDNTEGPELEYVHELQDCLDVVKRKHQYNVRGHGKHYQPGYKVWIYVTRRQRGNCPKMMRVWEGPCTVLQALSQVVYRVQRAGHRRKVVLHQDRMTPYRVGKPESTGFLEEQSEEETIALPALDLGDEAGEVGYPVVTDTPPTELPHATAEVQRCHLLHSSLSRDSTV
ncbi:uncharacterized protein LOC136712658 [Amia ocellicauda]|uniref:uncharacterized protein LOC136712658 n=1 Tax=Amia ocellicauda TaxID=2972642 RepID=UPI003464706A